MSHTTVATMLPAMSQTAAKKYKIDTCLEMNTGVGNGIKSQIPSEPAMALIMTVGKNAMPDRRPIIVPKVEQLNSNKYGYNPLTQDHNNVAATKTAAMTKTQFLVTLGRISIASLLGISVVRCHLLL